MNKSLRRVKIPTISVGIFSWEDCYDDLTVNNNRQPERKVLFMRWYSPFYERETRYPMCDECGHRMYKCKDKYGNWDGESYYCPVCAGEDDGEEIESCCTACGNPAYPDCKASCRIFDD